MDVVMQKKQTKVLRDLLTVEIDKLEELKGGFAAEDMQEYADDISDALEILAYSLERLNRHCRGW